MGYPRGARVSQIRPNTPAAAVPLQVGDVILEFGETTVEDDAHLINIVSLSKVGEPVPIVVWRDRKSLKFQVKLETRNTTDTAGAPVVNPG